MATHPLGDELLRNLEKLSPDKQRQVLAFARSLTESALPFRGTPGKDLIVFGGLIEASDLTKMAQAIEEDCEQVDRSGW